MLKAVLIDDEEIALDVMEILLNETGGVTVAGKFNQAAEAFKRLADIRPELVFLDIEMPGINGLAAAEQLHQHWPHAEIIFVTAYQEYALKAFDASAFDYLLKPVVKDRLAKTLLRYRQRHAGASDIGETELPSPSASETMPEEARKPCLQLHVMGSMELYNEKGRMLTWRTKKTKEMFAYLWHFAGAPVYRHKILDDLWPNLPMDRAQSLLHTTMYHLRSLLRNAGFPDMVMFGDERYWMRIECIESDAARLERLLQQEQSPSTGEQMLALYRGDYLEAEYYQWAEHKRYQLRAAYIRCLEQCLLQAYEPIQEEIVHQFVKLVPYEETHFHRLLEHLKERGETIAANRLRIQMERLQEE